MLVAVNETINLDYPRKDDSTLRQHLRKYVEQTGKWDERLDPPDIHPRVAHIWEWFWQIVGGKGEDGWWSCLLAWTKLTGNRPTPWESEIMGKLHEAYQKAVSEKMRQK